MAFGSEVENFIRPQLRSGPSGILVNKPPAAAPVKPQTREIIKLNANENPYGCSPRVARALADFRKFNLYPDASQKEIRKLLAEYVGVTPDYIVASAGAEQMLDIIVRLFVDAGDEVVIPEPTFGVYSFSTNMRGGKRVVVQRDQNFNVDVRAIKAAITPKTKLIVLCNPNNPTGNVTPEADLIDIAKTGVPVIIDEAYYEFMGTTMVPHINEYPNILIVRTFSKWAAMAGFRFGYGVAHPKLATYFMAIKTNFNVNQSAIVAATESLKDRDYLMKNVQSIIKERERIFIELEKMDFLKPYPTKGNFMFIAVTRGNAKEITRELDDRGILISFFDTPLLRHGIRISIGKPSDTDRLLEALHEIGQSIK